MLFTNSKLRNLLAVRWADSFYVHFISFVCVYIPSQTLRKPFVIPSQSVRIVWSI